MDMGWVLVKPQNNMKNESKWKWGLIIFILILLSIAIYYSTKERYFNPYEFSKENFVTNRAQGNYLDTIVHVGIDVLGIKNHSILLQNQISDKDLGDGYETQAYIITVGNQSAIFIDKNISRSTAIETLSHELIHLKQYIDGRLILLETTYVEWEGEKINVLDLPYDKRPWEIEAFDKQEELESKIKQKLYE